MKTSLEVDQTRRGARGNVRSDETLLWNPPSGGVIGTSGCFLSSEPCGRQLNRHTGYEASAAAKDGRASVQKPTDKTVEGSARHELPVGPLLGSYELTAGKDRQLTTAGRASHGSLSLPGMKAGVSRGESDDKR